MIHKLRHFGQDRFGNPSSGENFSFDLSKSFDTLRMAYDGKTFIRKLPTAQNSKLGFSLGNKTAIISFHRGCPTNRVPNVKTVQSHFYQTVEDGQSNVQGIYKLPLKDCVSNSLVLLVKSSRQNFNLRRC